MNPALRRLIPSVILNAALPLLVYVIVRPHAGTDTVALMIGAALPLLVTVGQWIWRRRVDPVGVLSLAGFGAVAVVLWLTGGDSLVAKLHDAIVTGPSAWPSSCRPWSATRCSASAARSPTRSPAEWCP